MTSLEKELAEVSEERKLLLLSDFWVQISERVRKVQEQYMYLERNFIMTQLP